MRRCGVLVLAVLIALGAGPVAAQAPLDSELVLITPVSKFIHDAALKAFAEYACTPSSEARSPSARPRARRPPTPMR